MKIYAHFPEDMSGCAAPWTMHIKEQVAETVDTFARYHSNDPANWDEKDGDYFAFPYFFQEDIHARSFINKKARCYLVDPEYELLFVWEPADFDDFCFEEDDMYQSICQKASIASDADVQIPAGFVYLGSYVSGRDKEVTLPGLVLDPDNEDGYEVLSSEMFPASQS